ncbi:hypothetical protein IG193_08655 [Infirmifilum lucidum]|uniref:Uncharacterized protein n=1 Tax=Infirmifilum lucidum TaxID=2776706 RepID=A0A7L9FIF2_9CREN|nr:hypothetical protein [Infirmifilum lucidum]QOJ78803.1 hypothetical protein IG193_08655 [Infirmifilum lucidum]
MEPVLLLLSSTASVAGSLAGFAYWLGRRLARLEMRVGALEKRVGSL